MPSNNPLRIVTFTLSGVLVLGTVHLWQFLALINSWNVAIQWLSTGANLFRLLIALAWSAIWYWFAIRLWQRQINTIRLLPYLVGGYTVYQLVYLAVAPSPIGREKWVMILLLGMVSVGISYWLTQQLIKTLSI